MFCPECGKELASDVATCTACGTRTATAASAPSSPNQVWDKIKVRSLDALNAVKIVVTNPVGGLPVAFQSLEKRQALEVGIVFTAVFELCALIGLYLMLPRWGGSPRLADVLKILIFGMIPSAAIVGGNSMLRRAFQASSGSIESDVFIAGITVLPFGVVALLAGILGAANLEVIAIVAVFALSYTILILYTGCTRISGISEARAAAAVPIIVLIAGWLSKVLFSAML